MQLKLWKWCQMQPKENWNESRRQTGLWPRNQRSKQQGILCLPSNRRRYPDPPSPTLQPARESSLLGSFLPPIKQEFLWQHQVTAAPPAGWWVGSHPNNKQPGKFFPAGLSSPNPTERHPGSSLGNPSTPSGIRSLDQMHWADQNNQERSWKPYSIAITTHKCRPGSVCWKTGWLPAQFKEFKEKPASSNIYNV